MRDYTTATEGKTLHDVVEDNVEPAPDGNAVEYHGFFIMRLHGGKYQVQYEGHVGHVHEFHADDYDDVTELVKDLNRKCLIQLHHFDYQDDKEGLVDWAGRMTTSDEQKAEENPELYLHVPENVPEA